MAKTQGKVIKLKNIRLSFPTLKEPSYPVGFEGQGDPKYSASLILDPEKHADTIKAVNAEINRMIKAEWGEKPPKFKPIEFFGKGDHKVNKDGEVYDGYQGMWFVDANNRKKPLLADRDNTILEGDDIGRRLYGGCYVNASIDMWIQDNKFGQAIRCNLRAVRFFGDGEAFGAGGASLDELDDLDDGEVDIDDDLGL
jgi:hypothetical protein